MLLKWDAEGIINTPAKRETLGMIYQPKSLFQSTCEMSTFLPEKKLLFNIDTYTYVL